MPRVRAATVAEHRRETLDRIYGAFQHLIDERGYDAVTLADIAKEVGLARTAIYNYFPDKEALLIAFSAREMDELFSDLRLQLAELDDPLDQLDHFVAVVLAYSMSHQLQPGPALKSVLSQHAFESMLDHAVLLRETYAAILDEAAKEGLAAPRASADESSIRFVLAALRGGHDDLTPAKLRRATADAQAFVRRVVSAPQRS